MSCKPMLLLVSLLTPCAASAQDATLAVARTAQTETAALDTPIEKIAATPTGCAILDKDFPGMRDHPMYGSFKRMSLNQIAAMSHGKITPDMLAQAQTDLSALDTAVPATTPVAMTAAP